jgi:hypothetical protein
MSDPDGQAPVAHPAPLTSPARRSPGAVLAAALAWTGRIVAVLLGLTLVAAGALAVRLARAPMPVTSLVRHFAAHQANGAHLALTQATLWWDRAAPQSPLLLTLHDLLLTRADRSVLGAARDASIAVLPAKLLLGRLRPIAVTLDQASIALLRRPDGSIAADTGAAAPSLTPGPARRWRRLRQVQLRGLAITVTDRSLGTNWQAHVAALDLGTLDGSAAGTADLTLALSGQTTRLTASLATSDATRLVTGAWTAIDPARLNLPALATLDAPIAGRFSARISAAGDLQTAAAALESGPGNVKLAGGALRLVAGTAEITADLPAHRASLTKAELDLRPAAGTPAPVLTATGALAWTQASANSVLALAVDRVPLADLARYWPPQAAPDARAWVTTNVTAGAATQAHFDLALTADRAHGGISVTRATGHLQAQDITLAWLRPVPPLVHGAATLTLLSPDAMTIVIRSATQTPSDPAAAPLLLTNTTLRITGLAAGTPIGLIDGDLAGPVAQSLALLREPRLHLLSEHPMAFGVPAGAHTAHIQMRLPLDAKVTIDQIAIHAKAQLTALHLGGVIGGKDLDQGQIALQASNDGLTLTGTAQLAGVPSNLAVAMDFRPGPPAQVLATYSGDGTASVAQLQAAGLPAGGLIDGSVGYTAQVTEHRDGSGQVRAHVDLRAAGLKLGPLGWQKPHDTDTVADASVLLDHDQVVAVDRLSVVGPNVNVQGKATYAAGQPVSLHFDTIELGRTRAAGDLRFATAADPTVHANLHGSVLDLASRLQPDPDRHTPGRAEAAAAARQRRTAAAAARAQRGRPWKADLAFDQVLLGANRSLTAVAAHAESDGLLLQRAQMTGHAGAGGFRVTLAPQGTSRGLVATAQDAGGLLRALDVATSVAGGTLSLGGAYDDTQPDHPLVGTALIDNFRIVGAPSVTRLLQAMTLYGVVDVMRGPGLGITHLIAPFRYADAVLTLDNARAFSSSLGFTTKGDIDLTAQRADLTGTIVPGYFFNTLLGKLPVLGKLFSPEQGGGVLSATYKLAGPLANPQVQVNPLAALTPGVLRGLFGIFDTDQPPPAAPPPAPAPPPAS